MSYHEEYQRKINEDKVKCDKIIDKYKDYFHPTEREYIEGESTCELSNSSLTSSKLFGKPYLPKSLRIFVPTDNDGVFLQILAQINLSDLPSFSQLPSKGILQF